MNSSNVNGSHEDNNTFNPPLDWSTSYQAGSSSSGSGSSDEESEDEASSSSRGRSISQRNMTSARKTSINTRPSLDNASGDSTGSIQSSVNGSARSYSPVSNRQTNKLLKSHRHASPMNQKSHRKDLFVTTSLFPGSLDLRFRIPLSRWSFILNMDFRRFAESMLLLVTLLYATKHVESFEEPAFLPKTLSDVREWLVFELYTVSFISSLYLFWIHTIYSKEVSQASNLPKETLQGSLLASPMTLQRPASPRLLDHRDSRQRFISLAANKSTFGYVWMSVPKNYRESIDDGIFTGLLLGPLISTALLINALRPASFKYVLPTGWIIEAPRYLNNSKSAYSASEALVLSRYSLVDLSVLCSTILLLHVCASWWFERHYSRSPHAKEGERTSVPRNEGRRALYYSLFTILVSILATLAKVGFRKNGVGIWQHISSFETIVGSLFFQFCLYIALRMAHRGLSLGELGLVCFGGTALWLEFLNLTVAQLRPITTAFIRTYRLPTPLLTFQIALVAGSFLTGFLLSPFLVLSRSYAKRPAHRFRLPQENQEKERNRRYAALGFYVGTVAIVAGLIGVWTRWLLGNRDPWLWVIHLTLEGEKRWHRPALLSYWGLLGCLSVAGWNRQLARSRKLRPRGGTSDFLGGLGFQDATVAQTSENGSPNTPTSASALSVSFPSLPNLPSLPNGVNVANVATDLLDAADKHVPTLKLNARRKFFHGLAVVMFIPGIAVDPAFTHLSFNVAFALFIFAEYIRYFAIYPFGVAIHLFMNEFLDDRDNGTAILSHFYLLTGCAGSVWLEGPTRLLQYTGILTLGVGDAIASIVGKRIGIHRWSPTTPKTLEGSAAFTVSIVASAWLLRLLGYAEPFSTLRYTMGVMIAAMLEALSEQNDNLTLPLYMWSILVLMD